MFPIDYHVHTDYTPHATGTVKEYCEMAKKIGIKEIAFTNHLILPKLGTIPRSNLEMATMRVEQIPEYLREIEEARKQFNIKIRFGMEVDYFEDSEAKIEKVISDYPLDFILGSVHYVDGLVISMPPSYSSKIFPGKDIFQLYMKYFSKLKKAVESQLFDVMSHLDIIRKNTVQYSNIPFEKYRKQAEAVANSLVDNGVGIEMNTFGYVHPVKDSYPSLEFLKICKNSGVKIVTIGSDAHSPSRLGADLERGIEKLKKAGYEKIYLFNQRKPKELLIV